MVVQGNTPACADRYNCAEWSCAAGTVSAVTEGRPPDVRDSLSELEQRLLELERELRADATSDASIARQRVPVPRPPHTPIERREPVAAGAPARETGGPPLEPNPGAGSGGRGATTHEDPASPDLAPLVYETQRRVDSLRDTLDGLTGASDRLREVAQVVVEDHGRALVRLQRATAWQRAQAVGIVAEPEAGAREEAIGAGAVLDEPPVEAPPEPVAAPGQPDDLRRRAARGRRRLLWWILAPLIVAAGLGTALLIYGGDDETPSPTSVPGASSRIALDVDLGPDREAFVSVPGTRPASDIGPEADLCDGVVGAAVVLRTAADESLPRCSGLVTIADGTVSARALAERGGSGERPCVNADQVSSLAATRRDTRLTEARQRSVRGALTKARRRIRGASLTASERVGTLAQAAYEAGRAFDSRRRLRLYAVRKRAGTKCIVPGRDDVAAGRYPLATRIELLTRARNAKQPAVQRAAVAIDNITSRPAPIDATVLRRAR